MDNPIKITINYNQNSLVEIQQWPIVQGHTPDTDRISVEFNGMSYSLVLDKDNPRIETWSLDENNEIKAIIAHTSLPRAPIVPA